MMEKLRQIFKDSFSLFSIISAGFTLLCILLVLISRASVEAADLLNSTLCFWIRRALALVSDILPFSIFALLVILSPIAVSAIVYFGIRAVKCGRGVRYLVNFLAALLLVYAGNLLCLGISYNTTTVDREMNIPIVEVDADNLASTMISLRDEINSLAPLIKYENGVSSPDCTMDGISEKICDSYSEFSREYGFVPDFYSRAKDAGPVSYIMSYLGITGIYTYFTGEANVNTCYPAYDTVFTAAHELSHQRGVLRENEANFMAYIICSRSDDVYLRYSAALNLYSYIASALYRTDPDRYYEIVKGLCDDASKDILASNAVSKKYGDTIFRDISNFVNDLFLKSHGTDGVVTYGRVVTLAVSYFEMNK
jgi:hypothetical protein